MSTAREATTHLADLLRREHHARGEFLLALAAFDRERRWVDLGYSSLFSFLTRELGLSAGAAQNRKTAAELVQKYPAVEAALREGRLCLSTVNEVAKVLTPENAAEVLPRYFGLSARDAAFVSASLRPVENPPKREFLVTPVRGSGSVEAPPAGASPLLQTHEVPPAPGASPSTTSPPLAPTPAPRPTIRPLDAERARMNITVSRRLLGKLAAARDALSHSNPGASEEEILEVGLDLILERQAKRRGLVAKPRKPSPAPSVAPSREAISAAPKDAAPRAPASTSQSATPAAATPPPVPPERSRYVRADVRRAVWKRDQGRCQWPVDGGGICGATYQVEVDHIPGWALGAESTIDRLRLLCRVHQDVHARRLYGDALMNNYTRPKGGGCSEPIAEYAPGRGASSCDASGGDSPAYRLSPRAGSGPARASRRPDSASA
jgi:5-methylcytosine-specific restriction endonuclease McrA